MTDSEPTQEEKDRALDWAKRHAEPPHPGIARDGMTNIAARCHLHATAELARAEERLLAMRTAVSVAAQERSFPYQVSLLERALKHDDKLARGEKETP